MALLPVCMWLELQDVLKDLPDNFDIILKYVSFTSNITRSTTTRKLVYNYRRTRLWPEIDLDKSVPTIKAHLTGVILLKPFHIATPALTTSTVPAPTVISPSIHNFITYSYEVLVCRQLLISCLGQALLPCTLNLTSRVLNSLVGTKMLFF